MGGYEMITKTFICDLCKKSVGEMELLPMQVDLTMPKAPNGYPQRLTVKKEICRECLEKKGVVTTIADEKEREIITAKNQKTLENKIVDFLADLGVAFTE
jgi:hypothetical protein